MEEVIIDIFKGKVTVKVNGVKGPACKALTADFEKGLGVKTSDTNTHEFSQLQSVEVKAHG